MRHWLSTTRRKLANLATKYHQSRLHFSLYAVRPRDVVATEYVRLRFETLNVVQRGRSQPWSKRGHSQFCILTSALRQIAGLVFEGSLDFGRRQLSSSSSGRSTTFLRPSSRPGFPWLRLFPSLDQTCRRSTLLINLTSAKTPAYRCNSSLT